MKRRDRPPALDIEDPAAGEQGEVRYDRDVANHSRKVPRFSPVESDAETDVPRSASATSSLDPYYFGVRTPSDSPIPPVPSVPSLPKTPEMHPYEPVTPGRDPAAIDRRMLVGVGELATPRWARGPRNDDFEFVAQERVDEINEEDPVEVDMPEDDREMSDSPWTIEAIDGEQDEGTEHLMDVKPVRSLRSHGSMSEVTDGEPPMEAKRARPLRSQRSMADESGGEEILYPRHPNSHSGDVPALPANGVPTSASDPGAPPSSFATPAQRPRKRTSEEFELDNGKPGLKGLPARTVKDKDKVRRHGVWVSGSASSSHGEAHHPRRMHNSDFSHLPPSPSSSSIQQFLKQSGNSSSSASSPLSTQPHLASNVAHSLLRGTQEGWSDLDDQTTMEALRKLDGLSGKSARARSSIGGHSRVGSSSRPGTPAKATSQWEGIEGDRRSSKRSSMHASLSGKDKSRDRDSAHRISSGVALEGPVDTDHAVTSGEDVHHGSPLPDKSTKKTGTASARSSFTPKRGSASSGTYASTPTTSSRDSASLSVGTSNTSVSAASGRQSSGKARRNSGGSDSSIGHGGDSGSARDRVAALVAPVDSADEGYVPPVPPLPKELHTYKSPVTSPGAAVPPTVEYSEVPERSRRETFNDVTFPSTLDVPAFPTTPSKHSSLQVPKSTTPTNLHKTPSKKWSFSSALALGKKRRPAGEGKVRPTGGQSARIAVLRGPG
ncbi:hypothetical protein C8T65DRAFT_747550 [Cerioporus squamosus]|nr:hypothetical protein C8T65DRAFT_747550 [Cerioporus squamosus]